jgi:hypothetical protein
MLRFFSIIVSPFESRELLIEGILTNAFGTGIRLFSPPARIPAEQYFKKLFIFTPYHRMPPPAFLRKQEGGGMNGFKKFIKFLLQGMNRMVHTKGGV